MGFDKLIPRRSGQRQCQAEQPATAAEPSVQAIRKPQKHKNAADCAQQAACNTTANSATKAKQTAPCEPQHDAAEQLGHDPNDPHGQHTAANVTASQQAEPNLATEPATKDKNSGVCPSVAKPQAVVGAKKRQRAGHSSNAAACDDTVLCQASSSHSKRPRSEVP